MIRWQTAWCSSENQINDITYRIGWSWSAAITCLVRLKWTLREADAKKTTPISLIMSGKGDCHNRPHNFGTISHALNECMREPASAAGPPWRLPSTLQRCSNRSESAFCSVRLSAHHKNATAVKNSEISRDLSCAIRDFKISFNLTSERGGWLLDVGLGAVAKILPAVLGSISPVPTH
jgi:hypothetical protein